VTPLCEPPAPRGARPLTEVPRDKDARGPYVEYGRSETHPAGAVRGEPAKRGRVAARNTQDAHTVVLRVVPKRANRR